MMTERHLFIIPVPSPPPLVNRLQFDNNTTRSTGEQSKQRVSLSERGRWWDCETQRESALFYN